MFLLVPAYPGSTGQRAIKRLCGCVWVWLCVGVGVGVVVVVCVCGCGCGCVWVWLCDELSTRSSLRLPFVTIDVQIICRFL